MKDFFKKIKKYPVVIFFGLLLYTIAVADIFSPVYRFSELENRYLRTWPKFSLRELFDNKYTPKIETYTEDHFIGRDLWISLKSVCESALGKTENNGIVYGKDDYMFVKSLDYDEDILDKNIETINGFAARHRDRNVRLLLAPTCPGVMTDKVLPESPVIDTDSVFDKVEEKLSVGILIDVRKALEEHSDEYIYYRTDHHWTTLGAYYAYRRRGSDLGYTAKNYEELPIVKGPEDFYGSHYSKAKKFDAVPDTIYYLESDCAMDISGEKQGLYDEKKLSERDKYAFFLHGNPGFATVYGKGRGKIMVIKDSYANCFVPFLTENYRQIDIVDLRYLTMGLDRFIAERDYDDILFLYNRETFVADTDLKKANMFNGGN